MRNHTRSHTGLLVVLVAAAFLLGQLAAVAPARAGAGSEQAAGSAVEARRAASLTLDAAPPAIADAGQGSSPAPTRGLGWNVLMTEGFEGAFPTGLWDVFDNNGPTGGDYVWDDDDYKPHTGARSAWPARGGANGVDPAVSLHYPNDMDSWMVFGPFDLTGYSAAKLEFWYWNQSELNYDWLSWMTSPDGTNFGGFGVSGDSGGWVFQSIDLTARLGDPSVWIAFGFQSNGSNVDDGPFVDDITLSALTGAAPVRDWTYMVYLDGDNNLEAAAVHDFLEMSSVGSTSQVAVVAQMDRIAGYDASYGNWTDTRRFYVVNSMTPIAANGTSIGEANMGDPATLVNFVQWATATYPADHYALVLWDHGNGWRSRALDDPIIQSIASDDSSSDSLDMVELRNALGTLTSAGADPFELIGLDACLMAMIEVDNQIRPYADVRVTSQETEPNDGAPLDAILTALVADPAITTEALATVYVDQYYASYGSSETQSAADLGVDYAALNTAVNNFAAALLANGAANAAGIQAARNAVQDFADVDSIDLYDFASRVQANVANATIDGAAEAVMAAMGPATVHEHHGVAWAGAHGISIYFPKTLAEYDARYDGSSGFLQFTADTQWDEWVRAYYTLGTLGKTAPANGATGVALSPTLSWQAVNGALWYGYCYDTTDNDACDPISWQDSGTATSAGLTGLSPNTTYYWQVFASTGPGPIYGDGGEWWSFTTGAPVPQEMTFHSLGGFDGWVLESDEVSAKGGSFDAAAATARLGDDGLDRQYRSILDFDTSGLPDAAVITGVTVRIKKQAIVGTNPLGTHGYLLVDLKTGFYHDIQVLEKYDFQAAGSRGNVGRFIKTPDGGWYRAPLRARNYSLISLTGTTQLRLRFEADDNDNLTADYLSFWTGNAAEADRPELIITYYLP
jgi:hypothetical protein